MTDEKPLTVVGHLAVVEMGGTRGGFGFVRVDLVIPPEPEGMKAVVASADEVFTFFSSLNNKATPFIMTIGGDDSE